MTVSAGSASVLRSNNFSDPVYKQLGPALLAMAPSGQNLAQASNHSTKPAEARRSPGSANCVEARQPTSSASSCEWTAGRGPLASPRRSPLILGRIGMQPILKLLQAQTHITIHQHSSAIVVLMLQRVNMTSPFCCGTHRRGFWWMRWHDLAQKMATARRNTPHYLKLRRMAGPMSLGSSSGRFSCSQPKLHM